MMQHGLPRSRNRCRCFAAVLYVLLIIFGVTRPASAQTGTFVEEAVPGMPAPDGADPPAQSGIPACDSRIRLQIGYSRITVHAEDTTQTLLYVSLNFRLSTSAPSGATPEPRLGLGVEGGLFYLLPYVKAGPELRYGDFYAEVHGGGILAALYDRNPIDFVWGALGGCSIGMLVSPFGTPWLELAAGIDYVGLFAAGGRSYLLPYATLAFRP